MVAHTASQVGGYIPFEPSVIAVSADGTLAAINEVSRITILEIASATPFAEIGVDPDALASEIAWVGAPPRLLVLARYAAHSTVHLLDPRGPRSIAEIRLEAPMRLFAAVGSAALVVGALGAAVLTATEAHLMAYQFPARNLPVAAGAAAGQFVVALSGSIEEWDPQSRMPKRRLRLPRAALITAVGGSDRVVWMTTQQEPARIDVIPLVNRGQPRAHDLPEPIARISGHPRSDLVACIGADSGRLYVVDLDGRTRLRVIGTEGIDRTESVGLVIGRMIGVLAAQTQRPIAIVTLDGRELDADAAGAAIAGTVPRVDPANQPGLRNGDAASSGHDEPRERSTRDEPGVGDRVDPRTLEADPADPRSVRTPDTDPADPRSVRTPDTAPADPRSAGTPEADRADPRSVRTPDADRADPHGAGTPDADPADLRSTRAPDADPTAAHGARTPDADPADVRGAGTPDADPADVRGAGTPDAEPADARGTRTSDAAPTDARGTRTSDTAPTDARGAGSPSRPGSTPPGATARQPASTPMASLFRPPVPPAMPARPAASSPARPAPTASERFSAWRDRARQSMPASPLASMPPPTAPALPPTAPALPPTAPALPPTAPALPPTAPARPPTAPALPPTAPARPPTAPAPALPPTAPPPTAPPPTAPALPPTAPALPVAPADARLSWRDEVAAWSRAIATGAIEHASPAVPTAPAIEAILGRFELAAQLYPALVLLYGAHLCGERGAAPIDVARVLDRQWDEALGRGELAQRGVAATLGSRVALSPVILRVLDELPPVNGVLIGEPGTGSLLGPCLAVAGDEHITAIAERCLARVGGAILAAHGEPDQAALLFEARAYGAAPMLRRPAGLAAVPSVPAIFVVADSELAEQLGLPRLA
jgi:hypothetical protein